MGEFSITITIADRKYRLTIEKDEEEIVRKASKSIEETIKNYAKNYAFKDKQDLLAMIALQNTTSYLTTKNKETSIDNNLIDKLSEIDKILSDNL